MAVSLLGLFVITGLTAVLPSSVALATNDRERAAFVISTRIDLNSLTVRDTESHIDIVPEGAPAIGGPVVEPASRPTTYTIKKGDTLSEVAISFGLSSYDLLAVNEGLARNQIQPGQEITIPTTAISEEQVAAMKAKEEAETKKVASKVTSASKATKANDTASSSSFRVPMSYKMISQYFGEDGHTGVDYAGAEGTPIYATGSGCIIHKASGWNGGYGNVFIQSLPGNKSALYGHLSKFAKLSVGDCVEQGDLIGYNGNTGRSTGPHLHFEIRVNGRPVNPLPYLKR